MRCFVATYRVLFGFKLDRVKPVNAAAYAKCIAAFGKPLAECNEVTRGDADRNVADCNAVGIRVVTAPDPRLYAGAASQQCGDFLPGLCHRNDLSATRR